MTLPARMTAIAIRAPGGPEMLVPEERPMPAPGAGEILVKVAAAGVNRPGRACSARGPIRRPRARPTFPASRSPARWWRSGADVKRWKVGDKVCALVVGGGYARILPGLRAACAAGAAGAFDGRSRGHSGDVLHRAGTTCSMRAAVNSGDWVAGARRHLGHRHHRDHAGQGVRRQSHHHRGLGGEMRGGQEARRRRRGQLQDRRLRRGDQGGDRRQGRQPDRRHGRRRLRRPQLRLPRPIEGRIAQVVVHRRPEGHRRISPT